MVKLFVIALVVLVVVVSGCRFALKDFNSSLGSLEAETKEIK